MFENGVDRLVNGLEEVTIWLVTLAILFMGFGIWFAGLTSLHCSQSG